MSENVIDLSKVLDKSGLEVEDSFRAGEEARAMLQLDQLDQRKEQRFVIQAPAHVTAMSPQFLRGLFRGSAFYFESSKDFLDHYQIEAHPLLASQIYRAVEYSLLRLKNTRD